MKLRSKQARGAVMVVLAAAVAGTTWLASRPSVDYTTTRVARADVESTVNAIGTLQPRRYVDVGAQVSGQILRLHVQPGAVVQKGTLLMEIDPSVQRATVDSGRAAIAGLRAQLADQTAQHQLAARQLARQRVMAADGATRDEDLQTAEATFDSAAAKLAVLRARIAETEATQRAEEARLGYTRVYAPITGTVVSVDAREGQTLNATYQTPNVLRIADLAGMTVWTEVSEADIARIRPAMPASFTTLGSADESAPRQWRGTVRQVLPAPPKSEGSSRSSEGTAPPAATKAVVYTVLFDVDNADGALLPQMTAQVSFTVARAQGAIVAPLAALTRDDKLPDRFHARVLDANGKPVARELRVGVRSRHLAEVKDGLSPGDALITGETPRAGVRWLQW